ncbi:MAG: hypothetical protein C4301_05930 [Thermus sp.]|uniref:hypothetical protein n=1 Tax=Thermus sp. TaxID=275 RepID=UPI00331B1EF3
MAFTLAQPYQGRSIPVYMGIYSAASPLGEHWEAFRDLKGYLRMEGVMSKTLGHATAYLENAEVTRQRTLKTLVTPKGRTLRLLAFAYALGLVVGVASRREQVVAMRRKWRQKGGLVGGDGGTTH